ncbi:MAG TPA: CHAT domain-containing tetratricopeptide repeat protein [Waterburya sp.]|jgi:CHAT domain-containing protein/Tfp pilus assembly protein PilF
MMQLKGTSAYLLLLITASQLISLAFLLQMAKIPLGIKAASAQTPTTQNRATEASQLFQTGVQQYHQGQFRAALTTFQQNLSIVRAIGKRQDEATLSNYIGQVYNKLGQVTKAVEFYQRALTLFREAGNRSGEGTVLSNLGKGYQDQGEYAKALKFYQQAVAIFREVGNRSGEGTTLSSMGEMYNMLGEYAKAQRFLQQALAISQEVSSRSDEAVTLRRIGEAYNRLEQYPKALDFLQQALVINRKVGDRSEEAAILLSTGIVYKNLKRYPKALSFYQQVLTISRELGQRRVEGAALHEMGIVYNTLKQYPKALELYQQVLPITQEVGDRPAQALTLTSIGSALLHTDQAAAAEKRLLSAVEIWESIRPGLTDVYKVSIFETQAKTYRELQQALVAQNKINSALEIAERGRARAFVELLSSRLSDQPNKQLSVKPLTIEQIRHLANVQQSTFVEYSIVSNALYIWVVQPTGVVAFKRVELTSLKTSLEDIVKASRRYIGIRGRGQEVGETVDSTRQYQTLRKLHKLLIEPIAELLPSQSNQRVIFIPQNELLLVPFPALQDAKGQYLIEQHTILTAPALQVLQLTRKKRERLGVGNFTVLEGKNALVVGNPTMPSITTQAGETEVLPPLPGAQAEAMEVAKLLKTKALTGNVATKASIVQQMLKAQIIHLATHGLLDDFKGLGVPGALAFAPEGTGQLNDGLLTADEIVDLKLNADLVVLSACNTGTGRITGDGVVGLSRSLITAGVPSVVVSLWSVPDASTEFLMTQFYQSFQQNLDKAQALRQAMLMTMKQYPNPINWAAFTLIGEAD